jgi:hypothetical protein
MGCIHTKGTQIWDLSVQDGLESESTMKNLGPSDFNTGTFSSFHCKYEWTALLPQNNCQHHLNTSIILIQPSYLLPSSKYIHHNVIYIISCFTCGEWLVLACPNDTSLLQVCKRRSLRLGMKGRLAPDWAEPWSAIGWLKLTFLCVEITVDFSGFQRCLHLFWYFLDYFWNDAMTSLCSGLWNREVPQGHPLGSVPGAKRDEFRRSYPPLRIS